MKVAVFFVVLGFIVTGCVRNQDAAGIPSDQKTPYVIGDNSADVLNKASELNRKTLASVLESVMESGAAAMVEREVALRDSNREPIYNTDGSPVILRQRSIVKVNSLQHIKELQQAGKVTLVLAGQAPLELDMPTDEIRAAMLEGMRLTVDSAQGVALDSEVAEIVKARANERAAILNGLAEVAEARGAAFATRAEALADGSVKIIEVTGREIIGRVTGVYPVEVAVEGAARVVEARIAADDGEERIVAEGDNADILLKAAE